MVYDTNGDSNHDETYELYGQREDRLQLNQTNDRMVFFKKNKLLILVTIFGIFLLGALTGFTFAITVSEEPKLKKKVKLLEGELNERNDRIQILSGANRDNVERISELEKHVKLFKCPVTTKQVTATTTTSTTRTINGEVETTTFDWLISDYYSDWG